MASPSPPPKSREATTRRRAKADEERTPTATQRGEGQQAAQNGVNSPEVYGFVAWISSSVLFVLYWVWAFVPDPVLHSYGVTYFPAKYWALAAPCMLSVAVVCLYWTYEGVNRLFVLAPDDPAQVTDVFANTDPPDKPQEGSIPSLADLEWTHVCRTLYGGRRRCNNKLF